MQQHMIAVELEHVSDAVEVEAANLAQANLVCRRRHFQKLCHQARFDRCVVLADLPIHRSNGVKLADEKNRECRISEDCTVDSRVNLLIELRAG